MKPKNKLLILILLAGTSSCVSFQKFAIEVYKPAEVSLPAEMHKILLISRNLKYPADTLQNYYMEGRYLQKDRKAFNVDSLAVTNCLDSLARRLSKQKRFYPVEAVRYNFMPVERVKEVRPASPEWYKSICEKSGADGLIVLDMFSCFYRRYNTPFSSARVISSNIWSVYDARSEKIIDRHPQIDTLIWDGQDELGKPVTFKVPDKKSAIALASGVMGVNYSKHLVPNWVKVNRQIMFTSNTDLQLAARLARKEKWNEASTIWTRLADDNNITKKTISLYNLALASEMNGDTDKAVQLIQRASALIIGKGDTEKNNAIRKYATVLVKRQNELNQLKLQHAD